MRLLNCEIVNGVSKEILTFSTLSGFGFNSELTIATVLMCEAPGRQMRLVIAEVHGVSITVFSFMDDLIVHGSSPINAVKPSVALKVIGCNQLLWSLDMAKIGMCEDIGNVNEYLCKPDEEFF